MQTQSGDVAVTLTDFVATVEIQRPPHNLLDIDLLRALATAFESLNDEAECRVLVLASAGRHFCAGTHFQFIPSTVRAVRNRTKSVRRDASESLLHLP